MEEGQETEGNVKGTERELRFIMYMYQLSWMNYVLQVCTNNSSSGGIYIFSDKLWHGQLALHGVTGPHGFSSDDFGSR